MCGNFSKYEGCLSQHIVSHEGRAVGNRDWLESNYIRILMRS